MKIAKCKYCGAEAEFEYDDGLCNVFCPHGDIDTYEWGENKAIKTWNSINTDEHGQQLTEQAIQWVEWDGDVEHLPEEGTTVFYMAPSEINQKPRGVIGEFVMFDCYPCISFWRCDGVTGAPKQKILIWLKKGDQFAVVEEDSHAS